MPGNDGYERVLAIDKLIQMCYTMGVKAELQSPLRIIKKS